MKLNLSATNILIFLKASIFEDDSLYKTRVFEWNKLFSREGSVRKKILIALPEIVEFFMIQWF